MYMLNVYTKCTGVYTKTSWTTRLISDSWPTRSSPNHDLPEGEAPDSAPCRHYALEYARGTSKRMSKKLSKHWLCENQPREPNTSGVQLLLHLRIGKSQDLGLSKHYECAMWLLRELEKRALRSSMRHERNAIRGKEIEVQDAVPASSTNPMQGRAPFSHLTRGWERGF